MPAVSTLRFERVLCAVDFSEHSRTALRYAAALARQRHSQLTAMFVNDPLLVAAAAAAYDRRALTSTTRRQLHEFVQGATGSTTDVHGLVALGDPAREIRRTATRLRADVIVLGTRGLGNARRLFFGSTAGRVLRAAPCAVLAVPPLARAARYPSAQWPAGRDLLAGIELGSRAASDARRAVAVARTLGTRTMLVTVLPPTQAPAWLHVDLRRREHERVQRARADLKRIAALAGHATVTVRAVVGDPAEQLAGIAADTDAALILMLLRPAGRLFGTRQGSVSYRVLCNAGAPVLALPDRSSGG
jgi:nucleotide-binding universal stress UspA family protein